MEYNTTRKHLVLPEHGRHIHDMVQHIKSLEEKEERNRAASAVIKLMGQLNPHLRDVEDFHHKLWDHLFIIADYELDVDSPYPLPEREVIERKPEPLGYPTSKLKYRHYGKSVESMIAKTVDMEPGEERESLVMLIANMMKNFYLRWNRDSVTDEVIWNQLSELSGGKLKQPEGFELTNTQDILRSQRPKNKKSNNSKNKSRKKGGR